VFSLEFVIVVIVEISLVVFLVMVSIEDFGWLVIHRLYFLVGNELYVKGGVLNCCVFDDIMM